MFHFNSLRQVRLGRAFLVLAALSFLGGSLFTALTATGAHAALFNNDGKESIVPCTKPIEVETSDSEICYKYECNVCDLQRLGMNIIGFLIGLGMVAAALLFCYAGWLYVTAGPSPGNVSRAHSVFLGTLVGLIIMLAAYLLVDVVMKSLYAENPKWGPWNDMLCKGEQEKYCVPKLKPMEATLTYGNNGTQSCTSQSGTCMSSGHCTNPPQGMTNPPRPGSKIVRGTDCEKDETYTKEYDNACCVPPSANDPCKLADGSDGTCQATTVCSGANSPSTSCTSPLVCCKKPAASADGYCSEEWLLKNGFNASNVTVASCICKKESFGGRDPVNASRCDICADSGTVVSYGIWQINLTAHSLGGNNCPGVLGDRARPNDPSYHGASRDCRGDSCCRVRNCQIGYKCPQGSASCMSEAQNIYNACVAYATDPALNTQWAAQHAGVFNDWAVSRGKCLNGE